MSTLKDIKIIEGKIFTLLVMGICLFIPTFIHCEQHGWLTFVPQWDEKTPRELFIADINGDGVMEKIIWGDTYIVPKSMKNQTFWQLNLSSGFYIPGIADVDKEKGDEICVTRVKKDTVFWDFINYKRELVAQGNFSVEALLKKGKRDTCRELPFANIMSEKQINYFKSAAKAETLLSKGRDSFGNWNGKIKIEKCSAQLKNNDGIDALISVATIFGLKPRGIGGCNIKEGRIMWWFPTAPYVWSVEAGNLNRDNIDDIVVGTWSPCNLNFVDDMDDCHAYIFALDCRGKLLWKREVGNNNCEAVPRIIDINSDGKDEVIVATLDHRVGGDNNMLFIFKGENGEDITFKKLQVPITSMETGFLKDGECIVISGNDNSIRIFNNFLEEIRHYFHPAPIVVRELSDLDKDGNSEIISVAGDYKLLILDSELNVIGKFEDNRISQDSRVVVIPSESQILLEYFREEDKEYVYTMLKVNMKIGEVDKTPPTISFDTPFKDTIITFAGRELSIRGKVYDEGKLDSISINGKIIRKIKDDTLYCFEQNIQNLPIGDTSFYISAWDKSGNQSYRKLQITRKSLMPEVWAIVVGVSTYSDSLIGNLKYAHKDAQAFWDFLQSRQKAGIFEVLHGSCLINEEATLLNVRTWLGERITKAKSKDYVFIYFACHGFVDDIGTPYLMLSDSKVKNKYATAFPMNELDRILADRINSENTIVIVDACRSGNVGSEFRGVPDIYSDLSRHIEKYTGKVFISASRAQQLSKEDSTYKHGVFTYHLLKGLGGNADSNRNNLITIMELFDYVEDKVSNDSYDAQRPMIKGSYNEKMIINVLGE